MWQYLLVENSMTLYSLEKWIGVSIWHAAVKIFSKIFVSGCMCSDAEGKVDLNSFHLFSREFQPRWVSMSADLDSMVQLDNRCIFCNGSYHTLVTGGFDIQPIYQSRSDVILKKTLNIIGFECYLSYIWSVGQ